MPIHHLPGLLVSRPTLARDLILEKERQNHDTNTNKSDEQDVRYKIGERTKRNTANQCNSVLLFPAIH